jgi:hypothetical protein
MHTFAAVCPGNRYFRTQSRTNLYSYVNTFWFAFPGNQGSLSGGSAAHTRDENYQGPVQNNIVLLYSCGKMQHIANLCEMCSVLYENYLPASVLHDDVVQITFHDLKLYHWQHRYYTGIWWKKKRWTTNIYLNLKNIIKQRYYTGNWRNTRPASSDQYRWAKGRIEPVSSP